MTTLVKQLGQRLAAARELRGLALEEAARNAFLDPNELTLVEAGQREPSFEQVAVLALLYRVSVDDLAGGYEPTRQPRPGTLDTAAGGGDADEPRAEGEAGTAQALRTNGHAQHHANGNGRILLPTGRVDMPPRPSFLRIAALVLGIVVLGGAVGVGTAVLWPSPPRNATKTLSYRDAILILVDSKETPKRRELSAARVFGATVAGIRALKSLGHEAGPLADQARRNLNQLRSVLAGDRAFTVSDRADAYLVVDPPLELAQRLGDAKHPLKDRQETKSRLVEAVTLGILALKKADTEPVLPEEIRANVSGYLATLTRELAK
jgi:transcriptional regulator with XRE-family HTH domain